MSLLRTSLKVFALMAGSIMCSAACTSRLMAPCGHTIEEHRRWQAESAKRESVEGEKTSQPQTQ